MRFGTELSELLCCCCDGTPRPKAIYGRNGLFWLTVQRHQSSLRQGDMAGLQNTVVNLISPKTPPPHGPLLRTSML
ncbi:hypothetical protein STEG23_001255 [Scotinomys teguina]